MRKLSILLLFILVQFSLLAQFKCGTDEYTDRLKKEDPAFAKKIREMDDKWAAFSKRNQAQNYKGGTKYEVPLVFHIIHRGDPIGTINNPTDATVQGWVQYLNDYFAATLSVKATVGNGGVEMPFKFVLAKRNEGCNTTSGILRVNGSSVPEYADYGVSNGGVNGASDVAVKALSRWASTDYINVYLVHAITGNAPGGGGVAAYASLPGGSSNRDGIVIDADYVDYAWTHEMGHYLGLYHTFQGSSDYTTCPDNFDCTQAGDLVCDTDPHPIPNGCPSGINTCTFTDFFNVSHNTMNYANCTDRMTEGQRDRMVFCLENYRADLISSLGDQTPTGISGPAEPVANCIPSDIIQAGNNFGIGPSYVELANLKKSSPSYTQDGFIFYRDYTKSTCNQLAQVAQLEKNQQYQLKVTSGAYNIEYARGWIDFNNDGSFSNSEMILDHQGALPEETHIATFTVPADVKTGVNLRMRIISDGAAQGACANLDFGQMEDYSVFVESGPFVNTAPKFIGNKTISLCDNAESIDLSILLRVSEIDIKQPLTWFVTLPPQKGKLFNFPHTDTSTGAIINAKTVAFVPNAGELGPDTFTVAITDGFDTAYTTIIANIYAGPTVKLKEFKALCSNAAEIKLSGGTPNGGVYSGTGVSSGNFNPSAGTQTITYTYTDENSCVVSAQGDLTVFTAPPKPVVTFSYPNLVSSSSSNNQWYIGGTAISGATAQTHVPTANGNYKVTVTDTNKCASESVAYSFKSLGIDSNTDLLTQVVIYPNPAQANLNVESAVELNYSVVDITGRVLLIGNLSAGKSQLKTEGLTTGTYYLLLSNKDLAPATIKFIKQ